jgi:hypothetical protein
VGSVSLSLLLPNGFHEKALTCQADVAALAVLEEPNDSSHP